MEHHGHVHAPLVGILLVPLERAIAALRPTPRIVGMAVGATNVIQAIHHVIGIFEQTVEELHLVHDAKWAAFL